MKKRIAYHTLGCKLNFSETSAISRKMSDKGYEKVELSEEADFYVVNTCSVTENANKKCRAIARQLKRKSPSAKVIFMGCYAQLKPDEISEIPGVSMVLGAKDKFRLDSYIESLDDSEEALVLNTPVKEVDFYTPAYSIDDRTRSFLKIQDGCDYFCSFCTIPLARGKSRSASTETVIKQAQEIAAKGIKEIVLTGVNTGDFGRSEDGRTRGEESFTDLILSLSKMEEIERWRISSIEPNLISAKVIETVASTKTFMPHFHIPLQSGSDKILKLMRRKYDSTFYTNKIQEIRDKIPHVCIGIDVIVGFPGESDEDFLTTYNFLKDLQPSYLHVFSYSERLNTKAASMDGSVDPSKRKERSEQLRSLSLKLQRSYYSKFERSERPVLFEAGNGTKDMHGFTDNYIKVKLPYDETLVNTVQNVRISGIDADGIAECELLQNKMKVTL
ncbi:MAG: tRNA (N(6)-L-threonylcarbamoyladenosine(37)-C(2))-methylthiotransferase MtaB [Chitinophagales bacterium]|nr:tRNA (N(6)-L-threonylcarbamoyladenosine(37)-C(2))-methylthiotransferase MtaB [Chitinophagales bacterium]